MWLAKVFGIDQDIISICYNKDIKLLSKNLVDVALKIGGCVEKTKRHYLVLEVAISNVEGRLPFVTFSNSYLMVDIIEIQLSKPLSLA